MTIKTKIITVTPQDAERYLSNMCNNRKRRDKRITKLTSTINRGEWGMTGQPIIFTATGKLLDGQHRMQAVIASGKAVEFLAVYGVSESMYSKIDDVAPRSIADALVGVANTRVVAGALKLLWAELQSNKGSMIHQTNYSMTSDQALELHQGHQRLTEAVSHVVGKKRVVAMLGGSIASYCLYRMRADSEVMANDFIDRLQTGEGLSARSPILSLRNLLTDKQRVGGVVTDWKHPERIALVARAWYMLVDRKVGAVTIAAARKEWAGWRTPL